MRIISSRYTSPDSGIIKQKMQILSGGDENMQLTDTLETNLNMLTHLTGGSADMIVSRMTVCGTACAWACTDQTHDTGAEKGEPRE
jgi:hypothetical protein